MRPAIGRGRLVVTLVVLAVVVLAAGSASWASGELAEGGAITVSGASAVPAIPALALATLAAAVALSLSASWWRRLLALTVVGCGAAIAGFALAAARDPGGLLRGPAATATGLSDAPLGQVSGSPLPWLVTVLGGALALGGLLALRLGERWAGPRRIGAEAAAGKFDGGSSGAERVQSRDTWGELDAGIDPTSGDHL